MSIARHSILHDFFSFFLIQHSAVTNFGCWFFCSSIYHHHNIYLCMYHYILIFYGINTMKQQYSTAVCPINWMMWYIIPLKAQPRCCYSIHHRIVSNDNEIKAPERWFIILNDIDSIFSIFFYTLLFVRACQCENQKLIKLEYYHHIGIHAVALMRKEKCCQLIFFLEQCTE